MIKYLIMALTLSTVIYANIVDANIIDDMHIKTYQTIAKCDKNFKEENIKESIAIAENVMNSDYVYTTHDIKIIEPNKQITEDDASICVFSFDCYVDFK